MKRSHLIYRNSLNPGLLLNLALVGVLLAFFFVAHTTLGMRLHEKEKQKRKLEETTAQLGNEIRRLDVDVSHLLSNGSLVSQMKSLGINLRLIQPSEIVELQTKESHD
ncbi:MAG: hypothetical protein KA004_00365 [Verrucomicrobiales bacterium]|nr:hypothetical protein [Verrucomicrobiales bacterium]